MSYPSNLLEHTDNAHEAMPMSQDVVGQFAQSVLDSKYERLSRLKKSPGGIHLAVPSPRYHEKRCRLTRHRPVEKK